MNVANDLSYYFIRTYILRSCPTILTLPWNRKSVLILGALLPLIGLLITVQGCGLFTSPYKPVFLETKTLVFYPDRSFNRELALPVDICFVTINNSAKEVTAVSPKDWFVKNKRDKYPFKQSLSIHPGNPSPITVQLQAPAETQSLVLMAHYINLKSAKGQQVVIASPGKTMEAIFVTDKGIFN